MNHSKKILFFLIVGFVFSNLFSYYNIKNFDLYENIDTDGEIRHSLLKGVNANHWYKAKDIKDDLNNGKNYFETGGSNEQNYLPSRIILIYSLITGHDLFDKNDETLIVTDNKKIVFLFFQTSLYFFLLIMLIFQLRSYLDSFTLFFLAAFLSIEPTIMQWHSSFWSESIFLSIQLLFFILIIKKNKTLFGYLMVGIILGVMFLQRSAAFFYIIPLLIYFFISVKNHKFKKIISFVLGYLIIMTYVGYHNYKRADLIYFTPFDQRIAINLYMLDTIVAESENLSKEEAREKISNDLDKWKIINSIDLNTEKGKLKYLNHMKNHSYKILINNPIITSKYIFKKSLHAAVLDPVYIYYFHEYEYEGTSPYYQSETHKFWVPIRLMYSIFFYLMVLYGFIYSISKLDTRVIFYCLFSYIYFFIILGWMGSTRYYVPCLIYLSIFFSLGMSQAFQAFNKSKRSSL